MTTDRFKDRSTGLVVLGILEIAIGGFCALLIPLALALTVASQSLAGSAAGPEVRTLVPGLLIYGLIAVGFVWIGVGSVRARRWARAVMLSLAWLWLITGLLSMVVFWVLVPRWIGVAGMSDLPGNALTLVMLTTGLFLGFIYVLLPLAFVLFYRSEHVAATCRARDPGPSWVDDCPQQIVTLVLLYGICAASLLIVPAYGFAFPLFGVILEGWSGAAAWLVVVALLLLLLVGTARRDPRAWTLAMVASIVAAVSSTVHAAMVPMSAWLDRVATSAEERQMMASVGDLTPTAMVLLSLAVWGSWIVYLFMVRRFFSSPVGPERSDR
jgi:hypothetical protein